MTTKIKKLIFKTVIIVIACAIGAVKASPQHHAIIIGSDLPIDNSDSFILEDDIAQISGALDESGYDVRTLVNEDTAAIETALIEFFNESHQAESRIIYLSAAIVSINGENFVLPSNARSTIKNALELNIHALALNPIWAQLSLDDVPGLFVIDANYPHFVDRDLNKAGLSGASDLLDLRVIPDNINVIVSSEDGHKNVARKNEDNDFNDILATELKSQGANSANLLQEIVSNTISASRNRQRPTLFNGGSEFLIGGAATPPYTDAEIKIYQFAIENDTESALKSFLRLFPTSVFADDVAKRLDVISNRKFLIPIGQDYYVLRPSNLRSGPGTNFPRVETAEPNHLLFVEGKVKGQRWYKLATTDEAPRYIFESLVAPYAGSELEAWNRSTSLNSQESYAAYLRQYPNGQFRDQAETQLANLAIAARQEQLAEYQIIPIEGALVLTRNANIRDWPEASGNLITTLPAGTIVRMTGQSQLNGWYQITVPQGQGYVWGRLAQRYENSVYEAWNIAKTEGSLDGYSQFIHHWPNSIFDDMALAAIENIVSNMTNSVPTDVSQLRSGRYRLLDSTNLLSRPRSTAAVLSRLNQGKIVKIVAISSNQLWAQVQGDFGLGWISSQSLVNQRTTEDSNTQTLDQMKNTEIIFKVTARVAPGYNQAGRDVLKKGDHVQYDIRSNDGLWARITSQANGNVWVPITALEQTNPPIHIGNNVVVRQVASRLPDKLNAYGIEVYKNSEVAEILTPNEVVDVHSIAPDGEWVLVTSSSGQLGWLPSDSVRKSVGVDLRDNLQPLNIKVIAIRNLDVYRTKQMSERIGIIDQGSTIAVLGSFSNGNIYQIETGKDLGYIQKSDTIPYQGSSKQAFEQAIGANNVSILQSFLAQYPNSFFRTDAIDRIEELQEDRQ